MADEALQSRFITLFASGDQVFVWNADEAFVLRSKHRIVGSLVGSLPRNPKQNLCFSLPLVLMREEARLLLDKGFARIVDSSKVVYKPSEEEVNTFNSLRDQSTKNQLKLFRKERQEKEKELWDVIDSGRKRKRRMDKNTVHLTQTKVPKDSYEHDDLSSGRTNEIEEQNERKKSTPVSHVLEDSCSDSILQDYPGQYFTELCTEEKDMKVVDLVKDDAVHQEQPCTQVNETRTMKSRKLFVQKKSENGGDNTDVVTDKVDVEGSDFQSFDLGTSAVLHHIPTAVHPKSVPQQVMDWTYPNTEDEKLHYKAFWDLWEKGYYITSGAKFGGDYLAYPGDPSRFHSFFIIVVLPRGRKVTPLDIISLGRLGSTVKKTAVFCSVNEDSQVIYTSVKWTGIS